MNHRRRGLALLAVLTVIRAEAQATLGSLLYADPVGRGIRLTVVASGLPEGMTLRPEEGEADRLRKLVQALAGPDRFPTAGILAEAPPIAWKVDGQPRGTLLRAGRTTYWRFQAGQVIPVRFILDGKAWSLQEATLPALRFGARP